MLDGGVLDLGWFIGLDVNESVAPIVLTVNVPSAVVPGAVVDGISRIGVTAYAGIVNRVSCRLHHTYVDR